MNNKVRYRYLYKYIELSNNTIIFKSAFSKLEYDFQAIEKIKIKIPKYNSVPGSGLSYYYEFVIFSLDRKQHYNIVLERTEEKELVELLRSKNVCLKIEYYDNKFNGSD